VLPQRERDAKPKYIGTPALHFFAPVISSDTFVKLLQA
jgi:hypothetical protein